MTGNSQAFSSFTLKESGIVTFGDNGKGKIIGCDKIGKFSSPVIENVLLFDGLKHNLFSVSQLCDKGHNVTFDKDSCIDNNINDNSIIFVGKD